MNSLCSSKLSSRYISWRGADGSSLGVGDFMLRVLITFKIFHKSSYEWAVVTKTVYQLKILELSKFNDRSPNMA